ncbi:Copper amine oxidase, N2-terminal [Penicillium expansum]|uniref:Amine oxidase n=1 Tax=Penicillium expansum TaxID=27334 RepID=A0A0A2JWY0_PENEN|nr:Copper amine oxidase, N2-terminal [Penicillium expansum]KGO56660.1 Copper amine oxidase, N2-terminal [Penicillium expansum]
MFHPLDPLSPTEHSKASQLLKDYHVAVPIRFKVIDLLEAPKASLLAYLHDKTATVKPPSRKVYAYYVKTGNSTMRKAKIDITNGKVESDIECPEIQGPADIDEIDRVYRMCNEHPAVQAEIKKLKLPKGAFVTNDPWTFGTDNANERRRLYQCYMYIVLNDDPEANHYSLPAPFAPIFDVDTWELLEIQKLPLGVGPELEVDTQPWNPVKAVEYSKTLLGNEYFRKDLKPLHVVQPSGPSFNIDGRKITWQKWSFHLGWTVREGPVLNNVHYDGRSLFHRVSMSEMTVPYGDPRSPYHRKQAFDLGDSGFGITSNTLTLGCDCLGHIAYFDGVRTSGNGEPVVMKNVICMHEVDNGIGWKHTNFRNNQASMVRNRQLVIQCTATVMNYEYILAFVLDQAANLHVEVKATGIVSTMPIREGIHSPWGTVVAPGVLAVNHQHLFCLRIHPALDGNKNTVAYDDMLPVRDEPELDPFGCAFRVQTTPVTKSGAYDLDLTKSRTYRIFNTQHINAVSGKPVRYKLHASPSQMLMVGSHTFNYKRGHFSTKPIWVTKYREEELWAAGEFTNQSRQDSGLAVWANRKDSVDNEDIVLWHSFGVTHVTRPEDFPVMPVETMNVSLKPTSFFELNPSNDVPRSDQTQNRSSLVEHQSVAPEESARGKWKNQTAPTSTISSTPQHQVQEVTETMERSKHFPPNENTLVDNQEPPFGIGLSDPAMSQASSPDISEAWPPLDHRAVELDDTLMLDRTEMLLIHYDREICPHQIALTVNDANNPYRKFILPLAYEQVGLLYALLGITAFHLGTAKEDSYLRDTLAVVYRLRAIRSLADTIEAGISGTIHENERDALFATIQILLLQDNEKRAVFFLGNLAWLDIVRSFANPSRLSFSKELRETISSLSDIKFEQVNGCPRKLFLLMGDILEHAKSHSLGELVDSEYKQLLEDARFKLHSWDVNDGKYPNDDQRWMAVAEAFRHACILYTSRLIDMYQPAEAAIIQSSVTAILDSVAEIPADCYLIELLVMPLFMAGTDALSRHARHYVLLRLDHIKSMAGVGNDLTRALLKSVWDAREDQEKYDSRNIPWVWFARNTTSNQENDYLII